jgi:hypothetical protein
MYCSIASLPEAIGDVLFGAARRCIRLPGLPGLPGLPIKE